MSPRSTLALAVMAGTCCAPCGTTATPRADLAAAPGPVIARLVQRRQVIVIRAGRDGPTYSVETRAGSVTVPAATLGGLARTSPATARTVREIQDSVLYAGLGD